MSTPAAVLLHNLTLLSTLLPSVRDADVEAIHDARIATRRIRAALDIIGRHPRHEDVNGGAPIVRRMGRMLGRVRDIDVQLELVRYVDSRLPQAAAALAEVRRDLLQRRERRARKLVKKLEQVEWRDVEEMRHHLSRVVRPSHRRETGEALRGRASRLAEAIAHASGVYFPDRAHSVRIAAKQLRYVVEAAPLGRRLSKRALKTLKRTQTTLGRLHDRQVLLDALAGQDGDCGRAMLAEWLSADCRELFDEYRGQRQDLLLVGVDLARAGAALAAAMPIRRVLAAAVAVAPAVLLHSYARHERARPGGVGTDSSAEGSGAGVADSRRGERAPTPLAS